MFFTFLKKLSEIELRIKKLQKAYFYMVNDYNQEDTSTEILINYNQILGKYKFEEKKSVACSQVDFLFTKLIGSNKFKNMQNISLVGY
jgi:hypothetical protein